MEYFAHGDVHRDVIEGAANSGHMDWGWGWLGMVTMAVLFVLIVLLIAKYLTSNAKTGSASHDQDALAILKKRYASGEVTKKQFDEIKKVITDN